MKGRTTATDMRIYCVVYTHTTLMCAHNTCTVLFIERLYLERHEVQV